MPDTPLPIIDPTYRLVHEVDSAPGEPPRETTSFRTAGRRGEAAAFALREALGAGSMTFDICYLERPDAEGPRGDERHQVPGEPAGP